jgi:6-phospho-beta-glucosidase
VSQPTPVIAILGGGVYVPQLCERLAAALPCAGEFRLAARRPDRLQIIATHSRRRLAARKSAWRVLTPPSVEALFDGASAVVLLLRVGGLAARAHDERFPTAFGLVGDEGLGPGGLANGYRTLPVLAEIAAALARRCPAALVCNLVAPLGLTTRLLLEHGLEAVGVCELPEVTLCQLAAAAHVAAEAVRFEYAGLNHLGWFWNVRAGAVDVLDRACAAGAVEASTLASYGAAPLRYFYEVYDRPAGARLGLRRTPGRAEHLAALAERILAHYQQAPGSEPAELAQRPTPWFDRALVPLLAAHLGGVAGPGFVNIGNTRRAGAPGAHAGPLLDELSPGVIVEVPARLEGTQLHPRRPGPRPPRVAQFLAAIAAAEDLGYQAARRRDRHLLRRALAALPLGIPAAVLDELTTACTAPPPALPHGER